MRKAVFIDIDGTLIDDAHAVPASAKAALAKAKANGHLLLFCTGRNSPEVPSYLWDLGFDGLVGAGGAYVEIDGQVVTDHRIDEDQIRQTTTWLEDRGLPYIWQTPTVLHTSPGFWEVLTEAWRLARGNTDEGDGAFIQQIAPAVQVGVPASASKAVALLPADTSVTLADFEDEFSKLYNVIPGSMGSTLGASVELVPFGVDKATGLRDAAEHIGIPLSETVAIGDSANDIEMVAEAGLGIAMGNALPEVFANADCSVASVDEDGLAEALEIAGLLE